jgi:eukaryotic-like serine/threonine-protein kinase
VERFLPSKFGPYDVIAPVGAGGMGEVYRARDSRLRRDVALKVLPPLFAIDPDRRQRFTNEAQAAAALNHPNILAVHDIGVENGTPFLITELIDGQELRKELERGALPVKRLLDLAVQIASGLQAAHAAGLVHRDLKPENVMVCRRDDGSEYAVVMDFGLAKERRAGAELQKLTGTGIILGTPEFMSPEQLRGRQLDGRSDVYSLALMTCEMLTGKLPFLGTTQQEIMMARLRGGPVPMRELRPDLDIPAAVQAVIDKALHRSPDDRYASAPEFAAALAAAQAAGPRRSDGFLAKLFRR